MWDLWSGGGGHYSFVFVFVFAINKPLYKCAWRVASCLLRLKLSDMSTSIRRAATYAPRESLRGGGGGCRWWADLGRRARVDIPYQAIYLRVQSFFYLYVGICTSTRREAGRNGITEVMHEGQRLPALYVSTYVCNHAGGIPIYMPAPAAERQPDSQTLPRRRPGEPVLGRPMRGGRGGGWGGLSGDLSSTLCNSLLIFLLWDGDGGGGVWQGG